MINCLNVLGPLQEEHLRKSVRQSTRRIQIAKKGVKRGPRIERDPGEKETLEKRDPGKKGSRKKRDPGKNGTQKKKDPGKKGTQDKGDPR